MRGQVILATNTEIDYAKQHGLQDMLNLSLTPFVKRITNASRINLKENSKKNLNELNGFIDKHEESKVVFFPQFNKGDVRSKEELQIIADIQLKSNLDTFLFQELSEKETLADFKKEFNRIKQLARQKEIFVLLDIKSQDIEDKIEFLLKEEIKNFIIRGGDYDNVPKWTEIRLMIHKTNGEFGISVHRRWDNDKVSYFKYALGLGCNYTFHEKPAPFKVDKMHILNIDNDFVYREINVDGNYGVSITEDNAYSFSRARTLIKAQELASSIELLKVA